MTTTTITHAAVKAQIADPETPEYFPESFPREDFPRYVWTTRPPGLPAEAWTTETTHRDGQQGGSGEKGPLPPTDDLRRGRHGLSPGLDGLQLGGMLVLHLLT